MTPLDIAQKVHDPEVARELHEFTRQLGESISVELSSRIDQMARQPAKRIGETIGELFPHILEEHFVREVLVDEGAAVTRARLVHALSALTLQSFEDDRRAPSGSRVRQAEPAPDRDEVLTSAEAARLLNVSRTYFNTLVEAGKLGAVERTEGGHRRISKSAVLAYKAESRRKQEQALTDMAAASEALGLYDDEMEGIPKRKKNR